MGAIHGDGTGSGDRFKKMCYDILVDTKTKVSAYYLYAFCTYGSIMLQLPFHFTSDSAGNFELNDTT